MRHEMVSESWFGNLNMRWISRKNASEAEKAVVGILAFEVANLMSKVVNLWHSLGDKEVIRLREDILNSVGIQKLVGDDNDYLMDLAFNEIIENFGNIARSVARLGKRCKDPVYHRFENFVNDPVVNNFEWFGWEYKLKKMERKVKKMERFVAVMMQLSQELEVLAELEQTLRRMQNNVELNGVKVLEFQQKVMWQRQEVRNLRGMSPWVRMYDYIVRLLIRSLFTILERIKHIFMINHMAHIEDKNESENLNAALISRSHSFSVPIHSSVIYREINPLGFSSKSGHKNKNGTNSKQLRGSGTGDKRFLHSRSRRSGPVGPFKGCMSSGGDSPILPGCKPTAGGSMRFSNVYTKHLENIHTGLISCNRVYTKLSIFSSKRGLLDAPPSTLGGAALALHHANIIILIEKMASSPHMIGHDIRDDLYNMLPTTIKIALRNKLRAYAKTLAFSVYNASLAAEWNLALAQILEWLAPLAHNMINWQSERSFEKENMVSRTNVLLVQTLHYANEAKTEAAIVELLMGLNYVCRVGNVSTIPEFSGDRVDDDTQMPR